MCCLFRTILPNNIKLESSSYLHYCFVYFFWLNSYLMATTAQHTSIMEYIWNVYLNGIQEKHNTKPTTAQIHCIKFVLRLLLIMYWKLSVVFCVDYKHQQKCSRFGFLSLFSLYYFLAQETVPLPSQIHQENDGHWITKGGKKKLWDFFIPCTSPISHV